jgi:hypothetical protein
MTEIFCFAQIWQLTSSLHFCLQEYTLQQNKSASSGGKQKVGWVGQQADKADWPGQ